MVCLSDLRQIGAAAQLHANEHRGYFPYAGPAYDNSGALVDPTPANLHDSQLQRYDYYNDTRTGRPSVVMPLAGSLAPYLGTPVRADATDNLVADLGAQQRFRPECAANLSLPFRPGRPFTRKHQRVRGRHDDYGQLQPEVAVPVYSSYFTGGSSTAAWYYTSYVFNIDVLGLSPQFPLDPTVGSNASDARWITGVFTYGYSLRRKSEPPAHADQTALMGDAGPIIAPDNARDPFKVDCFYGAMPNTDLFHCMLRTWWSNPTHVPFYSFASGPPMNMDPAGALSVFGQIEFRHNGYLNVVFVDGHAASLKMPKMLYTAPGIVDVTGMRLNGSGADLETAYTNAQ